MIYTSTQPKFFKSSAKGAFLMAITVQDFWVNEIVRTIPPKGKLVLFYILQCIEEGATVITEDISVATGIEQSVCNQYWRQFERKGIISGALHE